jgi:hypothetical protein
MPFPTLLILFFFVLDASVGYSREAISITQTKSGKSILVILVEVNEGILTCKTEQGKQFEIPLSELSPDSVDRINAKMTSSTALLADDLALGIKLNEFIGHQLFGSSSALWNEDAETVAKRLEWRLESRKKGTSGFLVGNFPLITRGLGLLGGNDGEAQDYTPADHLSLVVLV